jgi:EVE domain-containing protein
MSHFIFQATPDRYDLAREIIPRKKDTWYATRYRNEMAPGGVVFFWQSGPLSVRGIYGWGILTSKAYRKPSWDSFGVDVEYRVRFKEPVLASKLEHFSELAGMLIFRAPQATNFLLNEYEAQHLIQVIRRFGEQTP